MPQDDRTGVFESRRDFEESINAGKYFQAVARAYVDVLETPAVTAISFDEHHPNRKLGPQFIEFKADCDNAIHHALEGDLSLIDECYRLICGEKDVPQAAYLSRKVGWEFKRRKLLPAVYFVTIKRGRERHPKTGATR